LPYLRELIRCNVYDEIFLLDPSMGMPRPLRASLWASLTEHIVELAKSMVEQVSA
jgi:hypothetical protein